MDDSETIVFVKRGTGEVLFELEADAPMMAAIRDYCAEKHLTVDQFVNKAISDWLDAHEDARDPHD